MVQGGWTMTYRRSVGCDRRTGGAAWTVAIVLPVFLRNSVAALPVVAALVLAGSANGQCVPSIIGSVDTPGFAVGVAVSGALAYVADVDSGLQVIDVSDPGSPVILGSVDTPSSARGVAVSGAVAYVADADSGLHVIDVSDPGSPVFLGSVDTPGFALGVKVSGTVAYVADERSGLQVIDVSSCACPADLDGSGSVDFGDILAILSAWGNKGGPEDLDGSGVVDFGDLLIVLAAWGPCE